MSNPVPGDAAAWLVAERYRLLADSARDVVWTMAPDGRITYISPAVETVRGYTPAEAMTQALDQILTPGSAPETIDYFTRLGQAVAAGAPLPTYRGEQEYLCKDGSTYWADVLAFPITDANGTLVEILGVSRNAQERKRYEQRLLEANARAEAANAMLRAVNWELETGQRLAHVGSWRTDLTTNATEWSSELRRIYGLGEADPIPSWDAQRAAYSAEEQRGREAAVQALDAQPGTWSHEYDIVRPDGSRRHVLARGEPVLGPDGTPIALHGTILDVTDLREAQKRIHEAERGEVVMRLAGGIAHEFNNLLTSLLGNAELLADDLAATDPRREDLEAIQAAGRRATAITRQLMDFAQIRLRSPQNLDVASLVTELLPTIRSATGETLQVTVDVGSDPMPVRADRSQLTGAILTMVLSARDAMPEGGELALHVRENPATRMAEIAVADSGPGIADDVLPHVFEPFYAQDSLWKGLGLALSSVRGAAQQSGGFATATSRLGVGTTVTIHLPLLTA